jgi:hypothetical protein
MPSSNNDRSRTEVNERRRDTKPKKVVRLPDETDPAQERGERVETGKMIARGGKSTGHVPGASEAKTGRKSRG